MRTAVSIPDDVFAQAESLSRRLSVSRDELYAAALRDYLGRFDEDAVTRALNEVFADEANTSDPVITAAAIDTLRRVDW